jgi:peptidoglycan/LPS O-acetylase OafA/YrhL
VAEAQSHRNNFTPIRHVLAFLIVWFHAYCFVPPGTFQGKDPLYVLTHGVANFSFAVPIFLFLSGLMILESRDRNSTAPFLLRRAARIYPGYLLGCALALLVGGVIPNWQIIAQTFAFQYDDMYHHALVPQAMNFSLWSIPWEVLCYLILTALYPSKFFRNGWLPLLAAAVLIQFGNRIWPQHTMEIVGYFLLGAAIARFDLPKNAWLAFVGFFGALTAWTLIPTFPLTTLFAACGMFYAVWYLGLGVRAMKWPKNWDISYGLYVYAVPIQYWVARNPFLQSKGMTVELLATMAILIPAAALSWRFVERPILRLAHGKRKLPEAGGDAQMTPALSSEILEPQPISASI